MTQIGGGTKRAIPTGYYTISEVSEKTVIPLATLRWWRKNGTYAPQLRQQFGQIVVWLYTPQDIANLKKMRKETK